MHHPRFFANVFHDVDLAACRPALLPNVVAQHPERRPDSLSVRNFDARFKPSILLRELALRLQPARRVITGDSVSPAVFFLKGLNDKISALLNYVLRAAGVILEFLISPSVTARFCYPLRGIDRRTIRTVELVAPHKLPARTRNLRPALRRRANRDHKYGCVPFWANPTRNLSRSNVFENLPNYTHKVKFPPGKLRVQ